MTVFPGNRGISSSNVGQVVGDRKTFLENFVPGFLRRVSYKIFKSENGDPSDSDAGSLVDGKDTFAQLVLFLSDLVLAERHNGQDYSGECQNSSKGQRYSFRGPVPRPGPEPAQVMFFRFLVWLASGVLFMYHDVICSFLCRRFGFGQRVLMWAGRFATFLFFGGGFLFWFFMFPSTWGWWI